MKKVIDIQLSSFEDFKSTVELWECKGHSNVVQTRFLDDYIVLTVPDYVMPHISYSIVTNTN